MGSGKVFETQDGSHSVFSEAFGVSYHSKYGAIQESRHVFIGAGFLHQAGLKKELRVLEIGFGTGLNAFLTLVEARKLAVRVYYEALEAFPLSLEKVKELNYAAQPGISAQDAHLFLNLHTVDWGETHPLTPFFELKKVLTTFERYLPETLFDVVYFDAFAPETQPELWEPPILEKMYQALRPNGALVTYCAKGIVKRNLKNTGFRVEALPGPPGKREMTRAIKE